MIHKLWLTPTPTRTNYTPRIVDRDWQHRVPLKFYPLEHRTDPVPGSLRKPSGRNFRRLMRAAVEPKRGALGYPATAGTEPHWADVSGLETAEDRKTARNAMRRRRQGR